MLLRRQRRFLQPCPLRTSPLQFATAQTQPRLPAKLVLTKRHLFSLRLIALAHCPSLKNACGLWFLQQFLRDHSTYNVTMHYHISGPLRRHDLERAFQQVIHRHESLRTSFFIDPDTDLPTQAVLKDSSFRLEQKHNSTAKIEYEAMQEMSYDLENGNVTKAVIVPDSDGEFDLIFGFHHIALDGYSAQIMVRDLAMAYAGQTLSSKQ